MKYLSKLLSILLIGAMLYTVGCAKYDDDIRDLNNKIENLESMMNDQIAPMKTDLDAITTGLTKLVNDTEALTAAHASDLAKLTKANEELAKRIKALEDADFAQQVLDAIADFNDVVADLQTMDEAFKSQLAAVELSISKNVEDIAKVNEALTEYQVVVDAKILEIEARIETAEATLKDIEENIVPGLQSQIDANATAISQNSANIQLILGMLDIMSKADMAIQTLIATLEGDVDARLAEVNNTITEQFNAYWGEIIRVESEMTAKLNAQMLEIEALLEAINKAEGNIDYLKTLIEKNYEALSEKVTDVNNELNRYKETVTNEIKEAVDAATGSLLESIKIDNNKILEQYNQLNNKYSALVDEFNAFKTETNNRLTSIEENLEDINNKLAAMVQNITFVPEYTDGLATAVRVVGPKGSTLTATTLTAVFEVTPASAASVLATNGSVTVEPLKTRASVLRGERLAVEVVDAEAGRVKVTAFVHNMPEDYNTYAFTLNVEVENKIVASSDYVYIHENNDAEYQYALVTEKGNESIEKHANWNAERKALVFENKWTTASDKAVNALEGYAYKLTNGKDFYTLAEVESKFGMSKDALAVNLKSQMSEAYAEFVTATDDAVIDMKYDNEYQMYEYINAEAEIRYYADNAAFLNDSFKVYYKVAGVDVVDGVFTIEEEGDLYWLSQNQAYVFGQKQAKRVVFAEKLQLDMTGYNDAHTVLAPYVAISPSTVVSIEGNGATIENLEVKGVESVGLFGYVKGNIADLTVKNATIEGNHWVGGIAGRICGSIKNCNVENATIVANPHLVNGVYDDGDKAAGIVGYSEPNAANTPAEPIENCSVKNCTITAFRDAAGIVGATYFGDNLINNSVNDVKVLAVQRDILTPGYYKSANVGSVIGRDLMNVWNEANLASNRVANTDVRVRYAVGAEINVDPAYAAEPVLEISTANGLAWFSNHVTDEHYYTFQNVKLVEDIDFGGKLTFADDNVTFVAINNWAGKSYRKLNFDGGKKTISNFVYMEDRKDVGLFGSYVGDIKNILMKNVELKGRGRIAPIVTQIWGNVDNCHITDLKISVYPNADDGDKLGGIVGQMQDPNTITRCSVTNADIEGYRDLGGIAGHANLASWDATNRLSNVTIWINQTYEGYNGTHVPFKNEAAYVGRRTGVPVLVECEGAAVYNILDKDLYRRYVVTRNNQLRLGYEECTTKENTAALWKFASEYDKYSDVFQVTDMELEGIWTPIGTSAVPFKGTYNGNHKQIKGLQIADYNTTPSGFFGFARGTMTGLTIIEPSIYGSHYAGAVVAHMFGTVMDCKVIGGDIVLMPNTVNGRFDNGDKAGALVGYLAATGNGTDKIINNTVEGVSVMAYRDVAALVGCANDIKDMSGNTIKNCSIIVNQITGAYPADDVKDPNIGILIGRLTSSDATNIKNNTYAGSTLARLVKVAGGTRTEEIELVEIGSVGK